MLRVGGGHQLFVVGHCKWKATKTRAILFIATKAQYIQWWVILADNFLFFLSKRKYYIFLSDSLYILNHFNF